METAKPVYTGYLLPSQEEEAFFNENEIQLAQFYLKIPQIISSAKESDLDIKSVLKLAKKELENKVNFQENTINFKANVLAEVALQFYNSNK